MEEATVQPISCPETKHNSAWMWLFIIKLNQTWWRGQYRQQLKAHHHKFPAVFDVFIKFGGTVSRRYRRRSGVHRCLSIPRQNTPSWRTEPPQVISINLRKLVLIRFANVSSLMLKQQPALFYLFSLDLYFHLNFMSRNSRTKLLSKDFVGGILTQS